MASVTSRQRGLLLAIEARQPFEHQLAQDAQRVAEGVAARAQRLEGGAQGLAAGNAGRQQRQFAA
jgi:hypothetical protein